jgi:hypothetical protein
MLDQTSSLLFYKNLKSFEQIPGILVQDYYQNVPDDWFIVITDVKGSTKAIEQGRYKDVNVIGVSSIIATKNACGDIDVPFIFGGDGATIFIPTEKIEKVKGALAATKKKATEDFSLDLRVSVIPVSEIYKQKHELKVAKMKLSDTGFIAMAKGTGLSFAEDLTKKTNIYESTAQPDNEDPHSGLECRWNPIQSRKGEILTIIVQSRNAELVSYSELLKEIYQIVPDFKLMDKDKLSTAWPPVHLMKEMKMKYKVPRRYFYYALALILVGLFTPLVKLKRNTKGSTVEKYLQELSQNTDFIKFDETLRMVIDISLDEKKHLLELLEKYKKQELIYYGTHSSKEAMMTCFIQTNKDHVHFVDGGSGGYALAAKQLKQMKSA